MRGVSVLALVLGQVLASATMAPAQIYKSPPPPEKPEKIVPPRETGVPSGDGPASMRVPRRRPATDDEVKPDSDPAKSDHCAWIGKRIISLLVRDDAMAANDFTPFYKTFGCPEEHLSRAFGCLVANLHTLENNALGDQAEECWRDPAVRYVPVNNDKTAIEPSRPKVEGPSPPSPRPMQGN